MPMCFLKYQHDLKNPCACFAVMLLIIPLGGVQREIKVCALLCVRVHVRARVSLASLLLSLF